jgi:hypothetical protein
MSFFSASFENVPIAGVALIRSPSSSSEIAGGAGAASGAGAWGSCDGAGVCFGGEAGSGGAGLGSSAAGGGRSGASLGVGSGAGSGGASWLHANSSAHAASAIRADRVAIIVADDATREIFSPNPGRRARGCART